MANINLLQLPHQTYLLGPKHCGSWNCLRFQLGLSLTYSLLNKSNPSWMSVSQEVCVCVCVCVCARMRACMHILCNPMGCSLPGSSVRGIFQARILAWVAISSSKGSC